ncbi:T9SS type A sorting domain-containing protein [bacterium]|nr:T9SS type A sorting domain-containing protein [bacterium]
MKKSLLFGLSLSALLGFGSANAQLSLTVFHNNDGESKLTASGTGALADYGGVARFRSLMDTLRADATANGYEFITVSSGDNYLAGSEFNAGLYRANGPIYDAVVLADVNYDAICLGNHDFDFGPSVLERLIGDVKAINPTPFLSANLSFVNEPGLQAFVNTGDIAKSTIVTRGGQQIGIIGITTPSIANISSPGNTIIDANFVAAVQSEVNFLTGLGVKHIVLISHLQTITEELALVPQITGVDIVIAGGGDELLGDANTPIVPNDGPIDGTYPLIANDMMNNPVYVVTTPGEYKYIGALKVTFDANGVITSVDTTSGINRVASSAISGGVPNNAFIQQNVVDSVAVYVSGLGANIIATTQEPLDGLRNSVRSKETNLGNIVADAMKWQANQVAASFGVPQAEIGIQNGGGIRNNNILPVGNVSELNTSNILPFPNFVSMVEGITPAIFKEMVENFVSAANPGAGNPGDGRFAQVSGFSFIWDPAKTSLKYDQVTNAVIVPGNRVWEIRLDDGTYIVKDGFIVPGAPTVNLATNNFSAAGGDQYPLGALTQTTLGATYQQALFNYLTAANGLNGMVTTADYPAAGVGRIAKYTCVDMGMSVNLVSNYTYKVQWMAQMGATAYRVEYRALGTPTWIPAGTTGTDRNITFPGVGEYEVRVLAKVGSEFQVGCIEVVNHVCPVSVQLDVQRLGNNCSGLTTIVRATRNGGAAPISVNWSTGAMNTPTIVANEGDIVWVQVVDGSGCTVSDTLTVPFSIGSFAAATGLTVTRTGTMMNLSWNAAPMVAGDTLVGYQTGYRVKNSGNPFVMGSVQPGTSNMINFAANCNANYEFVVFAVWNINGMTQSAQSCSAFRGWNGGGVACKNAEGSFAEDRALSVSVYPNPARGEVFVGLNGAAAELSLLDLSGRLVRIAAVEGETEARFDLSGLAAGVYTLRIESEGQVAVEKLVIE